MKIWVPPKYTHLSNQQMRDAANANPLSKVKSRGNRVISTAAVKKLAVSESGDKAEQGEDSEEKKSR